MVCTTRMQHYHRTSYDIAEQGIGHIMFSANDTFLVKCHLLNQPLR